MNSKLILILLFLIHGSSVSAQESIGRAEIMSLQLIPHDLTAASRVFVLLDRDDSNAIDKTEAENLVDTADRNGDGKIVQEELTWHLSPSK